MVPGIVHDTLPEGSKDQSTMTSAPLRTIWPPLKLEEHPIDEPRPLRVVVVGGGISGITAAILLPVKVPGIDLVIYERQNDLGGVWNANIYPNVRCDVPAHAYQSTFAPATDWTEAYAQGAEIKAYWDRLATRYDVHKYVHLRHRVVSAVWSADTAKWQVEVATPMTTFVDEADFLVTATGHFSDPRLPTYPGLDSFQGHLFHTSAWDPSFDPANKKIAVIGNGASGIQVTPPLQKVAARLDHYARNPTWVAAPIGGEDLAAFVAARIDDARQSPEAYTALRKAVEARLSSRFGSLFTGPDTSEALRVSLTAKMAQRIGPDRPDLLAALVPSFSPNCRRLTPGPGYLEALKADNVRYIRTPISHFTPTGIVTTDGTLREVDAVVCSTGHDVSFSTAFPIVAHGVNLQTAWRPGGGDPGFPDTYLGIAAPDFPNLLLALGPNATGAAGTLCHAIELIWTYIARVLRKASRQGIRSMAPTAAATRDFRAYCESFFPRTVMSEDCSSWYNGGIRGGRIHGLWPGSASHLAIVRREPRWEDWTYTYHNSQGNRFGFLGNGWTRRDERAVAAATAGTPLNMDLTPWLRPEAVTGNIDLRNLHEDWWENDLVEENQRGKTNDVIV